MLPCSCLACQLQRLTDRVIEERVMNKFSQLADDIEADLLGLDKDADELNERRLAIKERARLATNAHHATYDAVEGGLKKLEDAAAGLGGRKNSKDDTKAREQKGNEEASGGTPGTSFQTETKAS